MRRCDRLRKLIDALRQKPKGDAKKLIDYRLMVDLLAERLFGEKLFGESVEAYISEITRPDATKLLAKLAETPEGIALLADLTQCR